MAGTARPAGPVVKDLPHAAMPAWQPGLPGHHCVARFVLRSYCPPIAALLRAYGGDADKVEAATSIYLMERFAFLERPRP